MQLLCSIVAGSVTDFSEPADGSNVLSWSSPSPPNAIILHYNITITPLDSEGMVITIEGIVMTIEVFNDTSIDISKHVISDGEFIAEAVEWRYYIFIELALSVSLMFFRVVKTVYCIYISLHSQMQAVTIVGTGNFSSPA